MDTTQYALETATSIEQTKLRLAHLLRRDAESRRYVSLRERRSTAAARRLLTLVALDGRQPVQSIESACARVHDGESEARAC